RRAVLPGEHAPAGGSGGGPALEPDRLLPGVSPAAGVHDPVDQGPGPAGSFLAHGLSVGAAAAADVQVVVADLLRYVDPEFLRSPERDLLHLRAHGGGGAEESGAPAADGRAAP